MTATVLEYQAFSGEPPHPPPGPAEVYGSPHGERAGVLLTDLAACGVNLLSTAPLSTLGPIGVTIATFALAGQFTKCGVDLVANLAPISERQRDEVKRSTAILTPQGFAAFAVGSMVRADRRAVTLAVDAANLTVDTVKLGLLGRRILDSQGINVPLEDKAVPLEALNAIISTSQSATAFNRSTRDFFDNDVHTPSSWPEPRDKPFIGDDPREIQPPGRGDIDSYPPATLDA